MTASFTVLNGNTTVKFEYTKPTATALAIVTNAAHDLWVLQGQEGNFDNLTNQQKLNLIDVHIKQVIMALAKDYYVNAAQYAARDTAATYADAELIL